MHILSCSRMLGAWHTGIVRLTPLLRENTTLPRAEKVYVALLQIMQSALRQEASHVAATGRTPVEILKRV